MSSEEITGLIREIHDCVYQEGITRGRKSQMAEDSEKLGGAIDMIQRAADILNDVAEYMRTL